MPLLHDIAHLGHAELLTQKPDKSLWFFTEVLGLTENGANRDSVYLRTWDDYEHHSLKLTASTTSGVGRTGLRQARDQRSLGYLVDLMEEVQADVAALDRTRPDLPSIGVSGEIRVRPEQRKAFLDELQQTLQDLFTRYGGAEGDAFRLAVACYPKGDPDDRA